MREGGLVQHPTEAFRTFFGQTEPWLAVFDLPVPESPEAAKANYQAWAAKVRLTPLLAPGDALAENLLDFAIHSGEGTALRALQRLLGLSADGLVGPKTRQAVDSANRLTLAQRLLAYRLRLMGKLLALEKNARYRQGWLNRISGLIELTPPPVV